MRLFFGLALPHGTRAAAAALSALAQERIAGRYVPAENYHVTLAFLGDTPPEDVPHAGEVLARCAAAFPAPTLTLQGFGCFGRRENAILILRVRSEPPLEPLHNRLVRALAQADLPADPGPFSPHITLARHAALPDALPACLPVSFTATQAHVFLSARDTAGVLRYTPLETVPFARARAEN